MTYEQYIQDRVDFIKNLLNLPEEWASYATHPPAIPNETAVNLAINLLGEKIILGIFNTRAIELVPGPIANERGGVGIDFNNLNSFKDSLTVYFYNDGEIVMDYSFLGKYIEEEEKFCSYFTFLVAFKEYMEKTVRS